MAATASAGPTIWARAIAVIERRGWYQGSYCGNESDFEAPPVCVLGAVLVVTTGDPIPSVQLDVYRYLPFRRLAARLGVRDALYVAKWNDALDRTVEDVYALLDELDVADRKAGSS